MRQRLLVVVCAAQLSGHHFRILRKLFIDAFSWQRTSAAQCCSRAWSDNRGSMLCPLSRLQCPGPEWSERSEAWRVCGRARRGVQMQKYCHRPHQVSMEVTSDPYPGISTSQCTGWLCQGRLDTLPSPPFCLIRSKCFLSSPEDPFIDRRTQVTPHRNSSALWRIPTKYSVLTRALAQH